MSSFHIHLDMLLIHVISLFWMLSLNGLHKALQPSTVSLPELCFLPLFSGQISFLHNSSLLSQIHSNGKWPRRNGQLPLSACVSCFWVSKQDWPHARASSVYSSSVKVVERKKLQSLRVYGFTTLTTTDKGLQRACVTASRNSIAAAIPAKVMFFPFL